MKYQVAEARKLGGTINQVKVSLMISERPTNLYAG